MPISADRFEDLNDGDGPTPGTNADRILTFLRENPGRAFTQSEIVDATDVTARSVGPTLGRLRERGCVDHRGTYWRVSDHDRSVDAAGGHATWTLAARESDDEAQEMADWADHAVDPRDHPDGD